MIPTKEQVERLNTEFVFYGFGTNYTQDELLIFEEISEVLNHFDKNRNTSEFGDSRDIEMWIEENHKGKVYYSDIQEICFIIKGE